MADSNPALARLKRRLEHLERPRAQSGLFALGPLLDARLGGGLARGAVHEVTGQDSACANGFALMLALCSAGCSAEPQASQKPLLWIRTDRTTRFAGALYGPGLAELGINPDRMMLVNAPDDAAAFQAAADIIGCTGIAAAIVEAGDAKKLDLTTSRRLALAAEKSGVTAFIVRHHAGEFASAASTRWAVWPALSTPEYGAPGCTALRLELIRHRGGVAPFEALMEWDRDGQSFRAPLSGAVLSAAERGPLAA